MYRKEIIYMGLYREGSRLGSAGFLKVENREHGSMLYLKIQNIPHAISGRFPIRIYNGSGWKEINGIVLQDGGGSWKEEFRETSDKVILQIKLPGEYDLEGRSKTAIEKTMPGKLDAVPKPASAKEDAAERLVTAKEDAVERLVTAKEDVVPKPASAKKEDTVDRPVTVREEDTVDRPVAVREELAVERPVTVREEDTVERAAAVKEEPAVSKPASDREEYVRKKKRVYPETILIQEELPRHMVENKVAAPQDMPEYNLKEDKWEQILDTYENIHPYGDERVYVKLEPKDFVILQSKYQYLVNNSFLLHGFYNYRYVILGKEQNYYLGVPGVFYEREKMVALMFGFEAFECPGGNVKAGEFGYYLRKVEL